MAERQAADLRTVLDDAFRAGAEAGAQVGTRQSQQAVQTAKLASRMTALAVKTRS